MTKRFGVGRTTIAMTFIFGSAGFLVPLASQDFPYPYLIASLLISSFAIVVYNITQMSLRQAIAPKRIQGRMNSVMRFLVWGTIPLGSLTGGILASTIGLRPTLFVGAAGATPLGAPDPPLPRAAHARRVPGEEPELELGALAGDMQSCRRSRSCRCTRAVAQQMTTAVRTLLSSLDSATWLSESAVAVYVPSPQDPDAKVRVASAPAASPVKKIRGKPSTVTVNARGRAGPLVFHRERSARRGR